MAILQRQIETAHADSVISGLTTAVTPTLTCEVTTTSAPTFGCREGPGSHITSRMGSVVDVSIPANAEIYSDCKN